MEDDKNYYIISDYYMGGDVQVDRWMAGTGKVMDFHNSRLTRGSLLSAALPFTSRSGYVSSYPPYGGHFNTFHSHFYSNIRKSLLCFSHIFHPFLVAPRAGLAGANGWGELVAGGDLRGVRAPGAGRSDAVGRSWSLWQNRIRQYLVGGDWNMTFIFPYIGNNHPTWLIFFRGVQTTNQIWNRVRLAMTVT